MVLIYFIGILSADVDLVVGMKDNAGGIKEDSLSTLIAIKALYVGHVFDVVFDYTVIPPNEAAEDTCDRVIRGKEDLQEQLEYHIGTCTYYLNEVLWRQFRMQTKENIHMEKILISGTGRAGTSFLVGIFTMLGFDTGFQKHQIGNIRFGDMEKAFTAPNYVVKNPTYLSQIEIILENIKVKFMIIPIRNYTEVAYSRMKREFAGKTNGGMLKGVRDINSSEKHSKFLIAEYMIHMMRFDIPTIFIDFERINNPAYLYEKLEPVLQELNLTFDSFVQEYRRVDYIYQFTRDTDENVGFKIAIPSDL